MADEKKPRDYLVGFGKPRQHTKFVKGQCGNPKGRPKGSKNFKTELVEELNSTVPITEQGQRRTITKRRAFVKQLVNRGAAGDPKAMPTLLSVINALEASAESDPTEDNGFKEEEALVVDSIMRRIREAAPDPLNSGDEGSPSPDKDSPETQER